MPVGIFARDPGSRPRKCTATLRPAQVFRKAKQFAFLSLCPRQESNLDYLVRSEKFYPLNYEGFRALM